MDVSEGGIIQLSISQIINIVYYLPRGKIGDIM